MSTFERWFKHKNWTPLSFQQEAETQIAQGNSGLISVPTGAGKTYAAYLPALETVETNKGVQILYITPLRALARDLEFALLDPIIHLQLPLRVEKRTGDTSTAARQKQLKNPPEILLTTPESLAILLSGPTANKRFSALQTLIIDEWHELLGTKRGVLLELCTARLKKWNTSLKIWGLTATIGNLDQAAQACVGIDRDPVLISTHLKREIDLQTILPEKLEKLPWAGPLGLRMLPYLLKILSPENSTLIFTNTRSQAERWHQAILEARPEWSHLIALHHSSIEKEIRESIEQRIKNGELRFVVCTSSLDLGVDFSPVDKVIQIGSPKSIARLIQRAGRAAHRPMAPCNITIVPTHALEIAELNGYRLALNDHAIEARPVLHNCFDVLLQHLVTCAIGGGFDKDDMYEEVRTAYSFKNLSKEDYEEALTFLTTGGKSLQAYPEYKKIHPEGNTYTLTDRQQILRHRLNIGTITSDPHVPVKLIHGKGLGFVEENFLTALRPGDRFLFAGRTLELVQFKDLTAYVRLSKGETRHAAVWQGGRLPFSAPLGHYLRKALGHPEDDYPESPFLEDVLRLQEKLSALPQENELLVELQKTREGYHLYLYPFEGKIIHQGLAYLIAHRLAQHCAGTFKISSNDYGLELLSHTPFAEELLQNALFDPHHLEEDIFALVNMYEVARGFFRDIARISGLVFQGYPSKLKTQRQIQISSGLLYEVFNKYDPHHLLLRQAKEEAKDKYFEMERLHQVLHRLHRSPIVISSLKHMSPFALPLYVERTAGNLTNETLAERIEKIKKSWKLS